MPVNFTQIFTDSFNFIRNQLSISMRFTAYFFIVAISINYLLPDISTENLQLTMSNNDSSTQGYSLPTSLNNLIYLGFIQLILELFISAWGTLTIHQLSKNIALPPITSFLLTLKRFIGFFFISTIITIAVLIGSAEIVVSYFTKQPVSPFSFLTTALSIFVFVRLNLAPIDYLTNNLTLNETIKKIWKVGTQRNIPLFTYFLINHFLLRLLIYQVNILLNGSLIALFIISLIYVFSFIFTYRFYSIFTHKV